MKAMLFTAKILSALLLLLLASVVSHADDTDIYLETASVPPEQLRPNVLFILDTSGSMQAGIGGAGNYNANTVYPGDKNFSGGAGEDDYLYLYFYNEYVNKVHKSQILTNKGSCRDVANTTYASGFVDVVYHAPDISSPVNMCRYNEASCQYIHSVGGSSGFGDYVSCIDRNDPDYTGVRGTGLFFLAANHHNYKQNLHRFTVLQRVMRDIIDANEDINMSIMRFNRGNGGYIVHESVNANDPNGINQIELKDAVNDLRFSGVTPLSETLWEAALFLRGENAEYGVGTPTPPEAFSDGNRYDSPIDYECQKSFIILLTDGQPVADNGRDRQISGLPGDTTCGGRDNCLDELAGWLWNNGQRDHSTSLNGIQTIAVDTIALGGGADPVLLRNTAAAGGGKFYQANNADELLKAFKESTQQKGFEKDTFVAPAVAVNSYTGLTHRNELYYALFQPGASPRWTGNIKKYRVENGKLVDSNGNDATNASGFFADNSLSLWTTPTDWKNDGSPAEVDGSTIEYGGFAYELDTPNIRELKLFTYTGPPPFNNGAKPTPVSLNQELVREENTNITTTLLGLGASTPASETERTTVLNWARGETAGLTQPNRYVSDMIHSQPVVVTYGTNETVNGQGNTVVNFDDTIFASSNLGFIYAMDAETGKEEFAYIPQELLPNLTKYQRDIGTFSDKPYGLDSPTVVWRNDANGDGNINAVSGDHVYLYQGMRRGGTGLYALDVTNRADPKLLWQIQGQAYEVNPTGDFRDLAQTWSVPQRGKVLWGCNNPNDVKTCKPRDVLFFGGGYDTAHDDAVNRGGVNKGNAIYMVDATTGELLWSVGRGSYHDLNLNNMTKSIPAEVTIADIDGKDYDLDGDGQLDGNSYIDFLFATDIDGNIWRFDFTDFPTNAQDFATGNRIASFGGGPGANFRRFYNAPDVAYFSERGTAPFLTVAVASGYRARPNNKDVNDFLYVFKDPNPLKAPEDTLGNPDYTYNGNNVIRPGNLGPNKNPTQYGWKLALTGKGEKGTSRTVTFDNQIVMTSFIPSEGGTCSASIGGGRYYVLDALNGASSLNGKVDYKDLKHGGIPPSPAIIFSTENVCTSNCGQNNETTEKRTDLLVCVGTECIDDDLDQSIKKTYWRENQ